MQSKFVAAVRRGGGRCVSSSRRSPSPRNRRAHHNPQIRRGLAGVIGSRRLRQCHQWPRASPSSPRTRPRYGRQARARLLCAGRRRPRQGRRAAASASKAESPQAAATQRRNPTDSGEILETFAPLVGLMRDRDRSRRHSAVYVEICIRKARAAAADSRRGAARRLGAGAGCSGAPGCPTFRSPASVPETDRSDGSGSATISAAPSPRWAGPTRRRSGGDRAWRSPARRRRPGETGSADRAFVLPLVQRQDARAARGRCPRRRARSLRTGRSSASSAPRTTCARSAWSAVSTSAGR
jgi:hypothetical protein